MSKQPYMPLFVRDFMADTGFLNMEEVGTYLTLLMAMWCNGGKVVDDDKHLSRYLRMKVEKWLKLKVKLLPFLSVDNGWISQKRLQKEYDFVSKKRLKMSQNSKVRWNKNKDLSEANGYAPTPTPIKKEDTLLVNTNKDVPSELNIKSEVWRKGVNMLVAEGMPDQKARSLVGKWRKLSGGDDAALNDLLEQAIDADPAVLAEWMGAALSGKSNRIRMKGEKYIIPPGTDQWDAWHRFFIKLNDPRIYTKGSLTVPSLWPR